MIRLPYSLEFLNFTHPNSCIAKIVLLFLPNLFHIFGLFSILEMCYRTPSFCLNLINLCTILAFKNELLKMSNKTYIW